MILRIPKISISTLFVIIPIYYFNSCTAEFFKHNAFFLPIVAGFSMIWLFAMFIEQQLNDGEKIKYLLLMGIYDLLLLLLVIMGMQKTISALVSNFTNILFLLFFGCVLIAYSGEKRKNDRKFIISVWCIDTIVSCLYSVYRLIDEPYLSRYLSTGSFHQTSDAVRARGIISFGGVYGLVLVLFVLFYLLIDEKQKRFSRLTLIIIFTVMILSAQFTIAILLLVAGLVIAVIANSMKKKNVTIRILIILAISIPVCIMLPFLLEVIADSKVFGYEVTHRISEISKMLAGGTIWGSDLMSRFLEYTKSIMAFFSSYGMGRLWVNSVKVGTHSELLDGFANYGFLYTLFIVGLFALYKYVMSIMQNSKAKYIYKIVFTLYIIMSLLNTSTWAPLTLILFVIIPFICLNEVDNTDAENNMERMLQ